MPPYFGQLASAHFAFDASFVATGRLSSAVKSGVISYAAASIGGMADGLGGIEQFIVQGTAGGIFNVVQGGEFGHGFITAGIGMLGVQGASAIGLAGNEAGGFITAAVIGGTVSEITGGKFANGAASAAFATVVSQVGLSKFGGNDTRTNEVDNWTTEDEAWLQETMAQTAIDLENGDVYAYEPGWMRQQERALLDGEFGTGTYTDVMSHAGGLALEGASWLSPYAGYKAAGYSFKYMRYKNAGGGGFNWYKNDVRRFAIEFHKFKYKGVEKARFHYHRGKTNSQVRKHRPYQGGL
ncbi:hypothetical protein [Shewanella fidelis]|uniref:hypothetical protein n=1 Tax=Shewanella fidelis TaxID=173509 RepID=UPI00048DDB22|nr:hypothetical protein [Shewanella fidelis]